jgi:hypothetical protein
MNYKLYEVERLGYSRMIDALTLAWLTVGV